MLTDVETLEEKVLEVLANLPAGYYKDVKIAARPQYAYPTVVIVMTMPHGSEIEFMAQMDGWQKDGRISFEQSLDKQRADHLPYNHVRHEITVAKDKDPKKIAGDLLRRFLPAYVDFYLDLTAKRDRSRGWRIQKDANVRRLTNIPHVTGGGGQGQDDDKTREIYLRGAGEGRAYGSGQVMTDSVNLTLNNLSLDEAEYILKYVSSGVGRLFDRPV